MDLSDEERLYLRLSVRGVLTFPKTAGRRTVLVLRKKGLVSLERRGKETRAYPTELGKKYLEEAEQK